MINYRLGLVYIDGGETWTPCTQRLLQHALCDQFGSAGVDEQSRWFHPCQVGCCHTVARILYQLDMQTEHVGTPEKFFLARGRLKAISAGASERATLPPRQHMHAKCIAITCYPTTNL